MLRGLDTWRGEVAMMLLIGSFTSYIVIFHTSFPVDTASLRGSAVFNRGTFPTSFAPPAYESALKHRCRSYLLLSEY